MDKSLAKQSFYSYSEHCEVLVCSEKRFESFALQSFQTFFLVFNSAQSAV
jgi:hypothetical protein